jgi:CheY-like chemotaxis protein
MGAARVEAVTAGNILVVDDSSINRELLCEMLRTAGYRTRVARNGAEALDLIGGAPPELVLLDIQMPGMSGFEVCTTLRADPRTRAIPVVFISALDDVSEKVRAFEAGGVDYVTKPFEPAEVLARVGSQIKLHRMQNELRLRNLELQRRNAELTLAHQRTEHLFTALADVLPGTVLDETYRIDERIGEGGFGAVYRGMHLRLQRPVAIKVLRPGSDATRDLARFKREGIAACRIAHVNAVEVLDCSVSSSGIAYLVMELLHGRSLGTLLIESRTLPPSRCAEIVVPVCDVLAVAHAAGIVHRDIKPHNIFLHDAGGREIVKVVDFGIAKLMDQPLETDAAELTVRGSIIGTPEYMAPERLAGRPHDERSDVYSVGVLLYYMLTGELPYATTGLDLLEALKVRLTTKPAPIAASVPPALGTVVMQCLEDAPEKRPALGAIVDALWSAAAMPPQS